MQYFKGGDFRNRYKIVGTLTTLSPLHIGDGGTGSDQSRFPQDEQNSDAETPQYTTVATDADGRAYIPGSSLKGCVRNWLSQIFSDMADLSPLNTPQRAVELQKFAEEINHDKELIRKKLQMTEALFGTGLNAGKLEFWDAAMQAPPPLPQGRSALAYCGYDAGRGTLVLKSTAIDPKTGAAAKNKLYNYEVVPKGAVFEITVCGQNLEDDELGMLFFALDGFDSFIYPITLGAMGGIGYGRFHFQSEKICYLDQRNFQQWMTEAVKTGHAGYRALPQLPESDRQDRMNRFKDNFLPLISKEAV